MNEPTREQLARVYHATNEVLQEKRDNGKAVMATKWEITEHLLGMGHLTIDECMKALAEKGVFELRKTVNHIPMLIPCDEKSTSA